MSFQLTPTQQAEFDSMHSFKEREEFIELCKLENEYNGEAVQQTPAADPATIPEPVQPVADVVAESTPTPDANTNVAGEDVDWKHEAETWKKRKADADKALTPVQQENARLRKEREASLSEVAELKNMFLSFKEELTAKIPTRTADEVAADDDFALTYPDVAQRIANMKRESEDSAKRMLDERLREIEKATRLQTERLEREQQEAYRARHEAQVKAVHPDLADHFDPNKNAPALAEWVKGQPPMIGAILHDPMSFTPADVIYALNLFKASTNTPAPKPPSLGDRVQSVRSTPQIATHADISYFSEEEMTDKNINALLQANRLNPTAMDEILAKYERTYERLSK